MLPELNEDVITLVIQATLCSAPIGPNLESTTRYRRRSLLPLSQACRHLREYCLPFMFREVYSTPRGIYPRSIWKYIVILHLRDRLPSSVERFDVSPYVDVLPSLVALRRLVLHVDPGITFDALLRAAGSTPHLYDLFLEDTQLAFPPLSSSPGLNHLRRLSISIATPPRNMSEDELRAELQNVHECMRTLSAHLQDLEIPADICPLRTLADHSWPQLRALVMTGHAPAYGRTTVSAAVANMHCLRVLHLNFSAYCESPLWTQPPIFLYGAPSTNSEDPPTPFHVAIPYLESLALSNVYHPVDTIFDQLPDGLTCLKVLACIDFVTSVRARYTNLSWPQRFPLSEREAFRVVQRTSYMAGLSELALMLSFLPTSDLVRAISESCPQLTVLELAYSGYDTRLFENTPFPSLDSLSKALCLLGGLRVLRISVADISVLSHPRFVTEENYCDFLPFLQSLANSMPVLQTIALSFIRDSWYMPGPRQPTMWLNFVVGVNSRGEAWVREEVVRFVGI